MQRCRKFRITEPFPSNISTTCKLCVSASDVSICLLPARMHAAAPYRSGATSHVEATARMNLCPEAKRSGARTVMNWWQSLLLLWVFASFRRRNSRLSYSIHGMIFQSFKNISRSIWGSTPKVLDGSGNSEFQRNGVEEPSKGENLKSGLQKVFCARASVTKSFIKTFRLDERSCQCNKQEFRPMKVTEPNNDYTLSAAFARDYDS